MVSFARTLRRCLVAALAVLATSSLALADPAPDDARRARPTEHRARGRRRRDPPRVPSVALGFANSGRLEHGAHLEEGASLRYLPGRSLHWGTDELVGLLRRASQRVFREHRVRLTVGDLSATHGGPVGHHASHQNGRDADLAFFALDARGRPVALDDYASFDGSGAAINGPRGLRFDTARNWALVAALVDDPGARVEHLFVSTPLRALLLSHARAAGAPAPTIARAALALHQPVGALPHRNHFHVRIACPANDPGCRDGVRPGPRRRTRVVRNGGPGAHRASPTQHPPARPARR